VSHASIGHLPGCVQHRKDIPADPPGVPNASTLKTRGYEKVLVYANTNSPTGTANLEAWAYDKDQSDWVVIWTQTLAAHLLAYEVPVYGGDIRVAARVFGGGATTICVCIAGAVPERPLGN
jgi:hypothetical protein